MKDVKKDILWRVGLIYAIMIIMALVIVGRIFQLQFIQGNFWKQKAGEIAQKDIIIEPSRGNIMSEDGKLLAVSVPFYEIRMDMKADGLTHKVFAENVDSLAICLANLFKDRSWKEYQKELRAAYNLGKRFHFIKNRVNYLQLKEMKKFPLFRMGQFKGGFIVLQTNVRVKPYGHLASRTIGSMSKERTVVGLEGAYDIDLRGVQGVKLMQRLSGDIWMPLSEGNEVEPQDGKDIVTNINVTFQDVAESALRRQLIESDADSGCVVLMEVKTGAIKAIANLTKNKDGYYYEKVNYVVNASTEPGSTFKLVSMVVAMEDGYISNLDDTINTGNGVTTYYGEKMKDSHEGGYGRISIRQVFEKSSNVGTSRLIWKFYKDQPSRFVNRIYKMRLNQKLGLEIKGEGVPHVKDPTDPSWSGLSLPWMSVGYELQLTPLQILTFYNAIANDGVMVKPMFVKEIRYHGELVKSYGPEILNPSVCSKSTISKAREMLEGVVQTGTATNLRNTSYKIAGKTGTAQIARRSSGYSDAEGKKTYQASFAGYFPADNPKYSCMVVIYSPSLRAYYGGQVAAPVFLEISDKVFATDMELQPGLIKPDKITVPHLSYGYLADIERICSEFNVPVGKADVSSDWVITSCDTSSVMLSNRIVRAGQVPNVIGMGLKDALYLLENQGLRVSVEGRGRVMKQSIEPGTKISGSLNILIQLG
jgi:cell division protein FtsI (penicillin-binding protein 3)